MSFRRKLFWILFVGLVALIAAVAATIGPLVFERNAYEHVASIESHSEYRDPQLLTGAWALPVARLYHRGAFEFQDNQSYCAPASLANILHSLGRNVSQHQAIDGTDFDPWFGILIGGMTMDEFADLARLHIDAPVVVIRNRSLPEFRALMASANDPSFRYAANFHRGPLFGRGHGHFSPILGYLAERDLVFVGDVNARYRPFLVSSERLWKATNTIDDATGRSRGLVRISVGLSRQLPPN